jgi:hypothetical protein
MRNLATILILSSCLASCSTDSSEIKKSISSDSPTESYSGVKTALDRLMERLEGTYSSYGQDNAGSSPIFLQMTRIWDHDKESSWLYVEHAFLNMPESPHYQRIFRMKEDISIDRVYIYSFRFVEDFQGIGKSLTPKILDLMDAGYIEEEQACQIFLKPVKRASGIYYRTATIADECQSSLFGARFLKSEMRVFEDRIELWERGGSDYEETDETIAKGFVFKKVEDVQ